MVWRASSAVTAGAPSAVVDRTESSSALEAVSLESTTTAMKKKPLSRPSMPPTRYDARGATKPPMKKMKSVVGCSVRLM